MRDGRLECGMAAWRRGWSTTTVMEKERIWTLNSNRLKVESTLLFDLCSMDDIVNGISEHNGIKLESLQRCVLLLDFCDESVLGVNVPRWKGRVCVCVCANGIWRDAYLHHAFLHTVWYLWHAKSARQCSPVCALMPVNQFHFTANHQVSCSHTINFANPMNRIEKENWKELIRHFDGARKVTAREFSFYRASNGWWQRHTRERDDTSKVVEFDPQNLIDT